ncbi:MAG: hypothetical protein ACRC18_06810 [Cetobacterium sp.]
MIKQKYNYSFFYDNYKYRHHGMFRNYYKKLDKEYRYFIIPKENINKYSEVAYRSNLDIDQIINELKQLNSQVAYITDKWASFPDVTQYEYINIEGYQDITKIYQNGNGVTKRKYNNELIYMYYANYHKNVMSARIDNSSVQVYYKGYTITSYFEDEIKVHKSVPLSPGIYMKYSSSEHKEMVEKVLNKVIKDNVRGFYDELIQSIKEEFRIR